MVNVNEIKRPPREKSPFVSAKEVATIARREQIPLVDGDVYCVGVDDGKRSYYCEARVLPNGLSEISQQLIAPHTVLKGARHVHAFGQNYAGGVRCGGVVAIDKMNDDILTAVKFARKLPTKDGPAATELTMTLNTLAGARHLKKMFPRMTGDVIVTAEKCGLKLENGGYELLDINNIYDLLSLNFINFTEGDNFSRVGFGNSSHVHGSILPFRFEAKVMLNPDSLSSKEILNRAFVEGKMLMDGYFYDASNGPLPS